MRHWTEDTDREAEEFFDGLTIAQIRRRQVLCDAQIVMAHGQHNDEALADLQRMSDALMGSMLRRSGRSI